MSDPVNTSDINADAQDWADPKTTNIARMLAFFILPSVFVLIALFAVFWGLTHPKKPVAVAAPFAAASAPATPSVTDKDAQIAQLQAQILALQAQHPAEAAVAPSQPVYSADPGALAQLSARVDRVEAAQRELVKATAAAYAARSLQMAAQNQQPFLSELAVAEPALNDPALSATLRPYAEKGVPSAISLAVAFPLAAKRANIAAHADDGKHGILDNLRHLIGSLISIRSVAGGQGAEGILASAEARLDSGDLKGAVAFLDTLSPAAQKALSPWLEQAHARVLVDDTTRRLSETALNRLSQMTNASTAPVNNGGVL